MRSVAITMLGLVLGCAAKSRGPAAGHEREGSHGHGETNLVKASEPCPGPTDPVVVRVLDSETLDPTDPVAFVREPEIHFVVFLQIVEAVAGPELGPRLGVLVHSPSLFAGDVWGFGASPQQHPATLELLWSEDYCMFELKQATPPEVEPDPDAPLQFQAPQVHAAIIG